MMNFNVNENFVTSACWMDEIKEDGFKTFFNWHFTDQPYIPFKDNNTTSDWNKDNSVMIIEQAINVLKKKSLFTLFNKIFVIRVMTHVVGDMHQPLHNISL